MISVPYVSMSFTCRSKSLREILDLYTDHKYKSDPDFDLRVVLDRCRDIIEIFLVTK